MAKYRPKVPLDLNSGTLKPIKQRFNYEKQWITYKKNYSFYDGYIDEWYNRKKVINELNSYFKTKCETELKNLNKQNNIVPLNTRQKRKKTKKKKAKYQPPKINSIDKEQENMNNNIISISDQLIIRKIKYDDSENQFAVLVTTDDDVDDDSDSYSNNIAKHENEVAKENKKYLFKKDLDTNESEHKIT